MKTALLLCEIALASLLAAGCVSTTECTLTDQIRSSDIKGVWIGYDQNCLLFYRLTLADGGKGKCVALFVDGTPNVYRIIGWDIKAGGLKLESVPVASAEPITMDAVTVNRREMRIHVKGVERSWSHQAVLHREDDVFKFAKLAEQIEAKTSP